MEQISASETKSHSAIQEIPCLLWKPSVHYRVHNSSPLGRILTHHQIKFIRNKMRLKLYETFPSVAV